MCNNSLYIYVFIENGFCINQHNDEQLQQKCGMKNSIVGNNITIRIYIN